MPFDAPRDLGPADRIALQHVRRVEARTLPPIYCALRQLCNLDVMEVLTLALRPPPSLTAIERALVNVAVRAFTGEVRAMRFVVDHLDLGRGPS
jgi:hypothetical protein